MRILPAVCLFCGLVAASAQEPSTAQTQITPAESMTQQTEAINRLAFMVGTWKGPGWIMLGPDHRANFTQTEVISRRLSGQLLTVEGDGRDAADPSHHVHEAFAVISYDTEARQYKFLAFANGQRVEEPATVTGNTFTWGLDVPGGQVRYTLTFTGNTWHEIGEYSRDHGATWTKNFEMTLTKAGS